MGKWKREIIPTIHKDKAREKVVEEINSEFTSEEKKNKLIKQLKVYDKIMGYKK